MSAPRNLIVLPVSTGKLIRAAARLDSRKLPFHAKVLHYEILRRKVQERRAA